MSKITLSLFCLIKKKLFLLLLFALINQQFLTQTVSVNGRITSNRFAVSNALVTFIYSADTTTQFITTTDNRGSYVLDVVTSVKSDNKQIPSNFNLGQNYPNPFSMKTSIPYDIDEESDISLIIYDLLGREVRKFSLGRQSIGNHRFTWDGRNKLGNKVGNGIYFYRLSDGMSSQVKKMVFNSNSMNSITLTSISKGLSNSQLKKQPGLTTLIAGNYNIRITNTGSTVPYLIETEMNDVLIQKDTTINLELSSIPVATVDMDSTKQIIRGFGGSNILLWRPDMTDSEIQTAFGTGEGELGFTILRIMLEADKSRWSLYLPTAKKAYDLGAIVIASPWYAPNNMVEQFDGRSRVKPEMYAEYATHIDSFVTFMANNGVPLYGVSVQNEPDITDQWTSWSSSEMFNFMKDNAHAINGTNVMAPESFQFRRDMSDPILNDSIACDNTDIVCGHIYGGGIANYPLAEQKGKEIWMTEYLINSPGSGENMDTSLTAAIATGASINACMRVNMSTYIWWYIVRYYGPINDETGFDPRMPKGAVTKKGYVMSQFSRFVRPGYFRVESWIVPSASGISFSAYKDIQTSKKVIVIINQNSEEKQIVLRFQNLNISENFTPFTTSANKNCEQGESILIEGENPLLTLEPNSVTTFISN